MEIFDFSGTLDSGYFPAKTLSQNCCYAQVETYESKNLFTDEGGWIVSTKNKYECMI